MDLKNSLELKRLMAGKRISSDYEALVNDAEKSKKTNTFVDHRTIPLGTNTWKGNAENQEKIVTMKYQHSGAIGIIGLAGSGKTVLLKRIMSYYLYFYNRVLGKNRPGLILDVQGDDHHLCRLENPKWYPLFWRQREKPCKLRNLKAYAPVFTEFECHKTDKLFGYSLSKLDRRDMRSLNLPEGGVRALYQLMQDNKELLADPEEFLDNLEKYPTSNREMQQVEADPTFKMKVTNPLHTATKNSLIGSLQTLVADKVFINKKSPMWKDNFIKELKQGKVIVLNLHQYQEYAPLIAGITLRDLYFARRDHHRRNDKSLDGPVVVIEEADLILPKEDDQLLKGSTKYTTEILRRGRKLGFLLLLATQQVSNLNAQVKEHTRQWLIGPNLTSSDIKFFSSFLSADVVSIIKRLNPSPRIDWKAKEWAYVLDKQTVLTFCPWNSPFALVPPGTRQYAE